MDGDSTQADLDQVGSTEDKQPGPIRRVFSALSNVFWGLVIVAAILFAWPAPWGGPVTIAKVQGHSMEPTLYTGDVAIALRHYSGNYDVGAIVVYRVQQGDLEGMVVHRIIKRLENGNYITQGDNKQSPDPWEIPPDWIFGEVVVMIPGVAGWLTLLKSPVFMAIMAGALVIWVFWPRKDELEDDEADGDGGETSSDRDESSSDGDGGETSSDGDEVSIPKGDEDIGSSERAGKPDGASTDGEAGKNTTENKEEPKP